MADINRTEYQYSTEEIPHIKRLRDDLMVSVKEEVHNRLDTLVSEETHELIDQALTACELQDIINAENASREEHGLEALDELDVDVNDILSDINDGRLIDAFDEEMFKAIITEPFNWEEAMRLVSKHMTADLSRWAVLGAFIDEHLLDIANTRFPGEAKPVEV